MVKYHSTWPVVDHPGASFGAAVAAAGAAVAAAAASLVLGGVAQAAPVTSHQARTAAAYTFTTGRSRKPLDIQAMWPLRDLDNAQYVR